MQSTLAVIAGPSAEKGAWARWYVGESDIGGGELVLSTEPYPLSFQTSDRSPVYMWADQNFRVLVPETGPGAGQWKVNTRGYVYAVGRSERLDDATHHFHWIPRLRPDPHAHVVSNAPDATIEEGVRGVHIPTGRVSFETIIRFMITEYGVRPIADWEAVLAENEALFARYRTWA